MTTVLTTPPSAGPRPTASSRTTWVWVGVLTLGFLVLFFDFIWRMLRVATDSRSASPGEVFGNLFTFSVSQDWSHALVIPFISLYYILQKRPQLAATPRRVFWPGLGVLFLGMFSYAFWITPGRNDMFQGYSMILALFGLVLFLLGPAMMRILWFPILFLGFAVKVSDRIWEEIAWQLQLIAARCASMLLNVIGIDAQVSGSTINLYRGLQKLEPLNVAEACSGLRMLMAFVALGVAMAFLFDRAWWQRLIMVLLCVPIAVAVNVVRVTVLGVLHLWAPQFAEGDVHKYVGLFMLIPALLVYLLLGWILDKIIIKDEDAEAQPAPPAAPVAFAEHDDRPASPARTAWGVVLGVVLAALVGACYGFFITYKRPDALGFYIAPGLSVALLIVSAAALLACCYAAWRLTHGGRRVGVPIGQATHVSMAVAAGVLFSSIFLLWGTLSVNGVVTQKERIDLRQPLYRVPEVFGDWRMVHEERETSEEILETLGTKEFITRTYQDRSWGGKSGGFARLHVAYYTGTPDTVPHVPDRCFVAGGMERRGVSYPKVDVAHRGGTYRKEENGRWTALSTLAHSRVDVPQTQFPITLFTYAEPGSAKASNVLYFFSANGKFLPSPDHVRLEGFNLSDRYSYYCKIEVGFPDVSDPEEARQRAEAFIAAALPEILACLPDWQKVQREQHRGQVAVE